MSISSGGQSDAVDGCVRLCVYEKVTGKHREGSHEEGEEGAPSKGRHAVRDVMDACCKYIRCWCVCVRARLNLSWWQNQNTGLYDPAQWAGLLHHHQTPSAHINTHTHNHTHIMCPSFSFLSPGCLPLSVLSLFHTKSYKNNSYLMCVLI